MVSFLEFVSQVEKQKLIMNCVIDVELCSKKKLAQSVSANNLQFKKSQRSICPHNELIMGNLGLPAALKEFFLGSVA